jgi:hypothetical protein
MSGLTVASRTVSKGLYRCKATANRSSFGEIQKSVLAAPPQPYLPTLLGPYPRG